MILNTNYIAANDRELSARKIDRQESKKLWSSFRKLTPGGVSSPVRSCYAVGVPPLVVQSGQGAYITDIDHNSYVDFCMSWGALLHGHAHPEIMSSAISAVEKGSSFGITSPYEEKLARRILSSILSLDMIRFVSSGTEATMSAVRLARAYTGKDNILKFQGHYHGHADQFLIHAGSGVHELPTASSQGVPEAFIRHTKTLPFNDLALLDEFFSNKEEAESLAAIIVEPVAANMGVVPMTHAFAQALDRYRKKYGILLIFDEVVTGFRLGKEGAQRLYGVQADLVCLGKVIGGGFPAAAFGGRREIMSLLAPLGKVYQAGTLSGNPVAMAAGEKALALALDTLDFYQTLKMRSRCFVLPVIQCIKELNLNACIQSVGTMWTLFFGTRRVETSRDIQALDNEMFKEYFVYMLEKGFYIPPLHNEGWFISSAHSVHDLTRAAHETISFLKERRQRLQ